VHATWVRELVERVAPELRGPRSAHGIRVLNRELANLRAGITHDLAEAPEAACACWRPHWPAPRTAGRRTGLVP
jgi:hypothetical protein